MIEEFLNAKHLIVKHVEAFGKEIKPIFTKLGPEFKGDAQIIAEALKREDANKVQKSVEDNGHYSLDTERGLFNIKAEHFTVVEKLDNPNAVTFNIHFKEVLTPCLDRKQICQVRHDVQHFPTNHDGFLAVYGDDLTVHSLHRQGDKRRAHGGGHGKGF